MSDFADNPLSLVADRLAVATTLDDRVMVALFGSRGFSGEFLGWGIDAFDRNKKQCAHKKVDWQSLGAASFEEFQTSVGNVFRTLGIKAQPVTTIDATDQKQAIVTMPVHNLIAFPTSQLPIVTSARQLVQAESTNLGTGRA